MGSVLAADVPEFADPSRKSSLSGSSREIPPLLFLQEVLLKRAADLVEALYGMPHNNQVGDGSLTHRPPPPPPRVTTTLDGQLAWVQRGLPGHTWPPERPMGGASVRPFVPSHCVFE